MATRTITFGPQHVEFPSDKLAPLRDSKHLVGNPEALRREINQYGYLYIPGLHDREEVLAARLAVLKYIRDSGIDKLDSSAPWESGVLDSRCGAGCVPFMEGTNDITHSDEVKKVLEGPRPFKFFQEFLGGEALTFDFKWLRGMHSTGFTGAHVDNVYMGRGTDELYTMWSPFDDVTIEMGTLAVCEGSNRLPSFDKFHQTYSACDIEKINMTGTGWFTKDPFEITERFGGQWKTNDFTAGDVLIFTMRTVHMSTTNTTGKVRISCDTRWQKHSDPVDSRYMGHVDIKPKFGLHGEINEVPPLSVTMEQMKKKWGFV